METLKNMNQSDNTILKEPKRRKITDNILVLYLLATLLILLGQTAGMLLGFLPFMTGSDAAITVYMYISFIGLWAVALLYMRFTKKNRPILLAIGSRASGNNVRNLLIGFIIGFGLNGICILAAWLHGDITLYYDSFQPLSFVLIFVSVFVQSSAEELICRGFLYQRLRQSYRSPAVAIIGSSLLFAILHLGNEGVTALSVLNIFVVGILFAFMVYYMDSLWCAMAMHAAWNFTQNILFGLPNSGLVSPYSVFRLDAAAAKSSFAYNVGFGIEGTLFADAVLILACCGAGGSLFDCFCPFFNCWIYTTVSIESTILIFPTALSGIAVAARHAATDTAAASRTGITGNAISSRLSVAAAPTRNVQIYPNTAPSTDAVRP